ncbi:MAG: hypothetical protein A4E51_00769 [Methanosaeta sp. PtaU1.Bin055]|nr:MAG: hypothetical protein A4E51_00769 [Methanosaeta sp. PtaU1.Bin055]
MRLSGPCLILALILLTAGCVSVQSPPLAAASLEEVDEAPPLIVSLYPFLDDVNEDDHARTIALLTRRYEEKYPDDRVEIFIDPAKSLYFENSLNLSASFEAADADLLEVEQTELDNLIAGGYIRPFATDSQSEQQMLRENLRGVVGPYRDIGVKGGMVYFVPTWLCAFYTFERSPPGTAPMAADFSSVMVLPDLYLSSYASAYGTDPALLDAAIIDAAAGAPDPGVIAALSERFSACTGTSGENLCMDGYYLEHDTAAEEFGAGMTDRYVGYSEMLYRILKSNPAVRNQSIQITGTPFGRDPAPSLAWVDGFVINKHTSQKKMDQAIRFIDFYNSPEVKEMIALSLDTDPARPLVPRYLLPASEEFYALPSVRDDPYYRQFYPVIRNMTPFPTGGLRGSMIPIYCYVTDALSETGLDVNRQVCAAGG